MSCRTLFVSYVLLCACLLLCLPVVCWGTPTHYQLSVAVAYAEGTFEGEVQVSYCNHTGTALDEIMFRIYPVEAADFAGARISITNVSSEHGPLDYDVSRQGSLLSVHLPALLQPDEQVRLTLAYRGSVPALVEKADTENSGFLAKTDAALTLMGFYPIVALHNGKDWVTTPVADHGDRPSAQPASYEITLTVNTGIVAIVPGIRLSETVQDEKTIVQYHIESALDVVVVLTDGHVLFEQHANGTPVNVWAPPGKQHEAERLMEIAVDAMSYFEESIGPYPFEQLDIILVPLSYPGGVEFSGGFLLSESAYKRLNEADYRMYTRLIAHEIAHQWFYAGVVSDALNAPWLDEALAVYLDLDFLRAQGYGSIVQAMFEEYSQKRQTYFSLYRQISPGDGVRDFPNTATYTIFVYQIGALFFERLRLELGDEMFRACLSDYYRQMNGRVASPTDLIRAIEQTCSCRIDDLLAEFRLP